MTARRRPWRMARTGAAVLVGGVAIVVAVSPGPTPPAHFWVRADTGSGRVSATRGGDAIPGLTVIDAPLDFSGRHCRCWKLHERLVREPSIVERFLASAGVRRATPGVRVTDVSARGADDEWIEYVLCPDALPAGARAPDDVVGEWTEFDEERPGQAGSPLVHWRLAADGAVSREPDNLERRVWRWGAVGDVVYLEGSLPSATTPAECASPSAHVVVWLRLLAPDRRTWRAPDWRTGRHVAAIR